MKLNEEEIMALAAPLVKNGGLISYFDLFSKSPTEKLDRKVLVDAGFTNEKLGEISPINFS